MTDEVMVYMVFMIDAVMGDTMGKLAFRRWVVRVSRCIVARADGSLLD